MTKFQERRHWSEELGQGYELDIFIGTLKEDRVAVSTRDVDDEHTLIHFTPRRARQIAQDLIDAAGHIEAQLFEVGDIVGGVTELRNLPRSATILTKTGRPFRKGRELNSDVWLTLDGMVTTHAGASLHGPFTVVYLPPHSEETYEKPHQASTLADPYEEQD